METLSYRLHDSSIYIGTINRTKGKNGLYFGDRALAGKIRKLLSDRGWQCEMDPEILKNYPTLKADRWMGRKWDLEFRMEITANQINIEFYQVLKWTNPNGARYDFDKLKRMTYIQRLQWQATVNAIVKFIESMGAERKQKPTKNDLLSHGCSKYDYNCKDGDGVIMRSGDVRYIRKNYGDCKYRLIRGTVHHNINNMWWFVVNQSTIMNVGSHDLFSCDKPKAGRYLEPLALRNHLQRLKAKAIQADDLKLALRLKRAMARFDKSDDVYIMTNGLYWRPGSAGYTSNVTEAGRYSRTHAESIVKGLGNEKDGRLIPVSG